MKQDEMGANCLGIHNVYFKQVFVLVRLALDVGPAHSKQVAGQVGSVHEQLVCLGIRLPGVALVVVGQAVASLDPAGLGGLLCQRALHGHGLLRLGAADVEHLLPHPEDGQVEAVGELAPHQRNHIGGFLDLLVAVGDTRALRQLRGRQLAVAHGVAHNVEVRDQEWVLLGDHGVHGLVD